MRIPTVIVVLLTLIAIVGAATAEVLDVQVKADQSLTALWEAKFADLKRGSEARKQDYNAQIARQRAAVADQKQRADADLAAAEAQIKQGESEYARAQIDAEVRQKEAELRTIRSNIEFVEPMIKQCLRPCHHQHRTSEAECFSTCQMNRYMGNMIGR